MSGLTFFFHFCSGADPLILKRTPTDRNKYAGIGATIFFTGLFASFAGGYAIFTVFKSYLAALLFGVLWGLMIFNLDRFIVMSLKKQDNRWSETFTATPRIILAVLIAFVIAKPLELKLFNSEIQSELVLMEQERIKEQEKTLKSRYEADILTLNTEIENLQDQIEEKRNVRDRLNTIAIQEADGTGGSKQKNLGPIYKAKKKDADLAQVELDKTITNLQPIIDQKRAAIVNIQTHKSEALLAMDKIPLDGFAARMDALGRLGQKSSTILWASIFITFLFIAIETAPLFVKLLSSKSPYDFKLQHHEVQFASHTKEKIDTLLSHSRETIEFHKEMNRFQRLQTLSAEKEILKEVISGELQKAKDKTLSWSEYKKKGRSFA